MASRRQTWKQPSSEVVLAEKPFDTQMSIEEILAQWEKTRQAAESAIQEVEDKKLQEGESLTRGKVI